jgi:hypothetical protein
MHAVLVEDVPDSRVRAIRQLGDMTQGPAGGILLEDVRLHL